MRPNSNLPLPNVFVIVIFIILVFVVAVVVVSSTKMKMTVIVTVDSSFIAMYIGISPCHNSIIIVILCRLILVHR